MTRSTLIAALVATTLAAASFESATSAQVFNLNMSGAQEIPPADPDGIGSGTLTINAATNQISWNFTYANIAAPTLMHIHTGAAGVNGPVLVNLGVVTSGGPGTLINSTVASAANVAAILANPTGFYVNIHNSPFPGGAIRGQLTPADPVVFPMVLSGANEVPGPGDPDGEASGTVTVNPGTNTISWNLVYSNIEEPTGMHIHTGAAGVSGPILVNMGVATTGGPGTLVNSVSGITNAIIAAILADPEGHYLNIHNLPFPAGAVREQLVAPEPTPCVGDFNGDGMVDGADLGTLLAAWGTDNPRIDLNDDGIVDGADLGTLLAAWGPCPE
jgi:hypothetical protein